MKSLAGKKLRGRALCIALAGLLFSCGKIQPPAAVGGEAPVVSAITDIAEAENQKLEILSRDGGCILRVGGTANGRTIPLVPKAPCHFLRAADRPVPGVFSYRDVNTEAVLIVSGTPASEPVRKTWNLEPGLVCGEESQGVLIRGGTVLVTKATRRGGVTCRDRGVDEKEYWAFAHDEK
ncbi:MAG: hypothetical protein ACKV2U_02635 [Bryobacteraceae bacterium]